MGGGARPTRVTQKERPSYCLKKIRPPWKGLYWSGFLLLTQNMDLYGKVGCIRLYCRERERERERNNKSVIQI